MANLYTASLADGLVSPFPDYLPKQTDAFTQNGAYVPKAAVIDAINVMPTEKGYTSFFGADLQLGQLPVDYVQDILVVRTLHGVTLLVALAPDGMYVACPGSYDTSALVAVDSEDLPEIPHLASQATINLVAGGFAWIRVAYAQFTSPDPWERWTWAIVTNRIMFYQAGIGAIIELSDGLAEQILVSYYNPTFIIGTYKVYEWQVHLELNTGDTMSEQSLEFSDALGTLTQTYTDKLHVRAVLAGIWQQKIQQFIGAKVRLVGGL